MSVMQGACVHQIFPLFSNAHLAPYLTRFLGDRGKGACCMCRMQSPDNAISVGL